MNVQTAALATKLLMFANSHGAQTMELELPRRVRDRKAPWLLGHCCWMLDQILASSPMEDQPPVTGERAHRWLGYVQGVCIARGVANLEDFERINKES